jgi:hypothetical protein
LVRGGFHNGSFEFEILEIFIFTLVKGGSKVNSLKLNDQVSNRVSFFARDVFLDLSHMSH